MYNKKKIYKVGWSNERDSKKAGMEATKKALKKFKRKTDIDFV